MIRNLPAPALALPLAAALGLSAFGQILLQSSFRQTCHPVSLFRANTTADPARIRDWSATLSAQGTLNRMIAVEITDLIWIAGLAATAILMTLLAARLLRRRNPAASDRLYRIAPYTALAPALDLVENVVSLAMLSDPTGFPDTLAHLHAAASWAKLAAIGTVATAIPAYAICAAIRGKGAGEES